VPILLSRAKNEVKTWISMIKKSHEIKFFSFIFNIIYIRHLKHLTTISGPYKPLTRLPMRIYAECVSWNLQTPQQERNQEPQILFSLVMVKKILVSFLTLLPFRLHMKYDTQND
jgi:hypothetical protein